MINTIIDYARNKAGMSQEEIEKQINQNQTVQTQSNAAEPLIGNVK